MHAGAEVFDHLVRLEDVAADLAAPANLPLFAVLTLHFSALFVLLALVELGLEQLHGEVAVLQLAALGLAGHHDPGGQVGEADGGFDFVHVLSAFAAAAVGVDAEVAIVDFDRGVLGDFRGHIHAGEGRVAALVAVKRADADQAVHSPFGLQVAVSIVAGDFEGDPFDSGLVTGLDVEDLRLHAVPLDPALIHAHEHVGPVAGFGPAGPGMDGEVGRIAVELAGQQTGDLKGIECFFDGLEFFDHFLLGLATGVAGGLLEGHFVEDGKIGRARFQSAEGFDQPAQAGDFFHIGLGLVLVVPEAGLGHAAFYRGQFGGEFVVVKETSAAASGVTRARRCRDCRIREGT